MMRLPYTERAGGIAGANTSTSVHDTATIDATSNALRPRSGGNVEGDAGARGGGLLDVVSVPGALDRFFGGTQVRRETGARSAAGTNESRPRTWTISASSTELINETR